jgi:hypothetical protein
MLNNIGKKKKWDGEVATDTAFNGRGNILI